MATVEEYLSAEDYLHLPGNGQPTELVRGVLVEMNMPNPRHGEICALVARIIGNHADEKQLGRVVSNDSGVITQRNPDTVRGADVAFYSYEDIPRGPLPQKYLDTPPRLIFEILSPSDRWADVLQKVAEYLKAGVRLVCVLDPEEEKAFLHFPDKPVKIVETDGELVLEEVLPGFKVLVRRIFE